MVATSQCRALHNRCRAEAWNKIIYCRAVQILWRKCFIRQRSIKRVVFFSSLILVDLWATLGCQIVGMYSPTIWLCYRDTARNIFWSSCFEKTYCFNNRKEGALHMPLCVVKHIACSTLNLFCWTNSALCNMRWLLQAAYTVSIKINYCQRRNGLKILGNPSLFSK